jgi:hypothetical protein
VTSVTTPASSVASSPASSSELALARIRWFLLALAVFMFGGVVAELALTEHTETLVQWIPFVLSGLGVIASIAVLLRPARWTIWALRAIMLAIALGGLLGVYEHLEGNLEFARETNASRANAAPVQAALTGGNPPLAPGALAVTALVAGAATYAHPALRK